MRRLARYLLALCSAVSLVLCVAACFLWVRSYRGSEYIHIDRVDETRRLWARWEVWSQRGSLRFGRERVRNVGADENLGDWPKGWRLGISEPQNVMFEPWDAFTRSGTVWDNSPGEPPPTGFRVAGIGYFCGDYGTGRVHEFRLFLLPFPVVALAFAAPPAVTILRFARRRRRRRGGLCLACGYDLRTRPERCPECGASTAAV